MTELTHEQRATHARRPAGRPTGFQRWRKLLFLHWEVDAEALASELPDELEVDTYEGRALVGVVPFTMRDVSPWWSPSVPGISNFHELNVRTYVLHRGIPGVWFFSLDAASSIAVTIARSAWHLPYHRAAMELHEREDGTVLYHSERRWPEPTPASFSASYRVLGASPRRAEPGTLDWFLVERYVLFARNKRGQMRLGRVHHEPYPLLDVAIDHVNQNVVEAAGLTRSSDDFLAHYSPGVDVDVYALEATSA